ncbi:MAG TPA: hypothetical protein VFE10_04060, partial [Phenylobacterium sp.]|nr:hypothetical protein [Phenylobacterium sp.]
MTSPRRPTLVLTALAVLALAGAARAGEPEAVATAASAGAGAPPTSTAEQIDAYLKSSPALVLPKDAANGVVSSDAPRQVLV